MERLVEEYKELLNSDEIASEKFRELDKRIKKHKRHTGVIARDVRRSNMLRHIINLIYEEAITKDDLADFSEDLRDAVETWIRIDEIE